MNLIKKMVCRGVQFGFRKALPFLPYKDPKILERVEDIISVLRERQMDSVLVVTDEYLRGSGMTKALEQRLWGNDIRCYVYDRAPRWIMWRKHWKSTFAGAARASSLLAAAL